MEEVTLSSIDDEIYKIIGYKAAVTDWAIINGVFFRDDVHIDGDNSLKGRTGYYWTKDKYSDKDAYAVSAYDCEAYATVSRRIIGVRPPLPFSSINKISTNGVSGGKKLNDRFIEIESKLLYVQYAPTKDIQIQLENKFQSKEIFAILRKGYTTDSRKVNDYGLEFLPKSNNVYQYNGKLYTRAVVNLCSEIKKAQLSNGEFYKDGDIVWAEVFPVKGVWDEKEKRFTPNNILMAGVPFDHTGKYPKDFKKSDIGKYLNEYFIKEVTQFRDLRSTDKIPSKNDKQINVAGVKVLPNDERADSGISEEKTAIEARNEDEIVLNGDTADSNIHENTTPIEATEQSAGEIANESTVSNEMRIDKIIDYFNNLKKQSTKLDAERIELIKKLDKIEAKKAEITKTIKEVEALIGKEGVGRDE